MTKPTRELRARWEAYAGIWKLTRPEAQRAACEQHLTAHCVYTDPLTRREGWDALVAYMREFHQQIPGGHFVTRDFRVLDHQAVVTWSMVAGDGTVLGEGMSHAEFAEDGKLRAMTGFFDLPGQ